MITTFFSDFNSFVKKIRQDSKPVRPQCSHTVKATDCRDHGSFLSPCPGTQQSPALCQSSVRGSHWRQAAGGASLSCPRLSTRRVLCPFCTRNVAQSSSGSMGLSLSFQCVSVAEVNVRPLAIEPSWASKAYSEFKQCDTSSFLLYG